MNRRLTLLFAVLLVAGAWADTASVGVLYRAPGETSGAQASQVVLPGGEVKAIPGFEAGQVGVPSLSPDGKQAAFVYSDSKDHFQLVVAGVDGEEKKVLEAGSALFLSPAWSPDGKKLVASKFVEATKLVTLVVFDLESGDQQALDCGNRLCLAPAWKPDGSQVLFTSINMEKKIPRLATIPAEGGPVTVLSQEFRAEPSWSPDGRQLVYVGRGPENQPSLFVSDAAGKESKMILGGEGGVSPRWTNSGILFNRPSEGGAMELWSVQPEGSKRELVTQTGASAMLADAQGFLVPFYIKLAKP